MNFTNTFQSPQWGDNSKVFNHQVNFSLRNTIPHTTIRFQGFYKKYRYTQQPCSIPLLPKSHKPKNSTTCSGANLSIMSICVGMWRVLPFTQGALRNAIMRSILVASPNYLNQSTPRSPKERRYGQQPQWRPYYLNQTTPRRARHLLKQISV